MLFWLPEVWDKNFFNFLVKSTDYDYYSAYKHFASGLCCGLSSLVIIVLMSVNFGLGSWICDWNYWGRGCESEFTWGKSLRRDAIDAYFLRSLRIIWINRIVNTYLMIIFLIISQKWISELKMLVKLLNLKKF